jgi:hypothetical protein
VDVACKVLDIDQIMIPNNFSNAATLIQNNFPSLEVEQFSDASVIILPGRQVASNSIVQAGTIFGKKQYTLLRSIDIQHLS